MKGSSSRHPGGPGGRPPPSRPGIPSGDRPALPAGDGSAVTADPWQALRRHTPARIALGRSGVSVPTGELLRFGLAHAQARDAVLQPLDAAALERDFRGAGFEVLTTRSAAPDRATYLLRPDLGRRLDEAEIERLQSAGAPPCDLLLVAGDGLSALAVQRHALPLARAVRERTPAGWTLGPVVIATQARVALGDDIGQALGARLVAVLIGERPGLSSPDSLGVYLTWAPRRGRSDAERNCISNVRPQGLSSAHAADALWWLAQAAARLQATGVVLKDERGPSPPGAGAAGSDR
ncbi:ethanolamine ammonia-lyase subunit EutC [Aquabacterium sp. J223]|uniref:ethanolamine ammonia-lyase subunit EutC n=1 Tax=Aquabacterium sp. J223 TaxID=2898431 RepID=UPI0021AE069B|nr:ethanolamine ammonia-lyase subunit EutC [Aquabacterium sp. J223]UUX97265.1 ethanolamine ammonia-lyase subunit EutC [Aquabacterium sp. J223]